MPTPKVDYRFTPSQLDTFQDFLDCEYLWEQFWGNSEEPNKSLEEYAVECEKKLIDQINRCPQQPFEAADRGTAFNEAVDCVIHNRESQRKDMSILWFYNDRYCLIEFNGFSFQFDLDLIYNVAKRYPNAISQYFCEAPLQTSKGIVSLYGYPDEWCGCKVSDLKTTKQYTFGKFERKWQKHVYPFAIVESGDSTEITEFEYTAVKLFEPTIKCPVIRGEIYPEIYTYDHEQSRRLLQSHCEMLIDWLEHRRSFITDSKIFGGENPVGYIGVPVDKNLLFS